jgi:hypothetical protein
MGKRRVRQHLRRTKDGITPVRQHFRKYQKVKKLNKPQPAKEIKRKCFRCDKALKYDEFIARNIGKLSKEYLTEIWFDEEVELYCCGCFNIGMAKSPQDFIEKTDSMTERLREAKELGMNIGAGVVEANLDDLEFFIDIAGEDPDEILSAIDSAFQDNYSQSASYANRTLPALRSISGFEDEGYRTYQDDQGNDQVWFDFDAVFEKYQSGIHKQMKLDFDKLFPDAYKKYQEEQYMKKFKKIDEFL